MVFTDASLGNGPNGATMAGCIMYLTDGSIEGSEGDMDANILASHLRRLRRVARSTFAAENLMATNATDATYPLQYLWMEIFGEKIMQSATQAVIPSMIMFIFTNKLRRNDYW